MKASLICLCVNDLQKAARFVCREGIKGERLPNGLAACSEGIGWPQSTSSYRFVTQLCDGSISKQFRNNWIKVQKCLLFIFVPAVVHQKHFNLHATCAAYLFLCCSKFKWLLIFCWMPHFRSSSPAWKLKFFSSLHRPMPGVVHLRVKLLCFCCIHSQRINVLKGRTAHGFPLFALVAKCRWEQALFNAVFHWYQIFYRKTGAPLKLGFW